MKLGQVSDLIKSDGPYLTAYLDVGRGTALAAHELEVRWQAAGVELLSQGAPHDLVDRVGERVVEPTRQHGPVGRLVAAAGPDQLAHGRRTVPVGAARAGRSRRCRPRAARRVAGPAGAHLVGRRRGAAPDARGRR